MAEYIEREAALDNVNGWREQLIPTYGENDEYVKCLEFVAAHLESIPAADVRPVVKAKWNHRKDSAWCGGGCTECSACGFGYSDKCYHEVEEFSFCPNCGADMREAAE